MTAAGYSTTPLVKKLGIKPDHRVVLVGRPQGWDIPDLPATVIVTDHADAAGDVTIAFLRSLHDFETAAGALLERLPVNGALWLAWPRRAAGHTSDITENDLRRVLLVEGVVDVKVAAIDHDWSGLKFVWRKDRRNDRRAT